MSYQWYWVNNLSAKIKGLIWVAAACLVGAFFALGISPLAHLVPWKVEQKLSRLFLFEPSSKSCQGNAQARQILARLVGRLYPLYPKDSDSSVDVFVVQDPSINAYATLGGMIFINSGLLEQAKSPEELAGVLAHEISHVSNRHVLEGSLVHILTVEGIKILVSGQPSSSSNLARYFLNMSFTKRQEVQADQEGLDRLKQAQIDNKGISEFFKRMSQDNLAEKFLSDHPSKQDRIEMARKIEAYDIRPSISPDEWKILQNFCKNKF